MFNQNEIRRTFVETLHISNNRKLAHIKWKDGHSSKFHSQWLRFNCHCQKCKPDVHGKYLLRIQDFPQPLFIDDACVKGETLHICIKDEILTDHVTKLPSEWLRRHCYCDGCLEAKMSSRDVIAENIETKKDASFDMPTYDVEVTSKDEGLFRILKSVLKVGFCLLKNAPTVVNTVLEIARLISPIQNNHLEESFHIKTDQHKRGVAFTEEELPAHMDQCMYEVPPGVQLLHCIRFDECVTGGVTTLVDVFEAASILREESPELFQTLAAVPATFSASNKLDVERGHFEHQKTHIVLDYNDKIVAVNWNPVLQTTLQVKEEDVDRYYLAYNAFMKVLDRDSLKTNYRLKDGDILLVNNRRCAHARSSYQLNGGTRQLQIAYVNADFVKNKYMRLGMKLNFDVIPPKIGNSSSY